jgi:hypothetical protein
MFQYGMEIGMLIPLAIITEITFLHPLRMCKPYYSLLQVGPDV